MLSVEVLLSKQGENDLDVEHLDSTALQQLAPRARRVHFASDKEQAAFWSSVCSICIFHYFSLLSCIAHDTLRFISWQPDILNNTLACALDTAGPHPKEQPLNRLKQESDPTKLHLNSVSQTKMKSHVERSLGH